jgi:dolichol-phosphate mannosyltransferase
MRCGARRSLSRWLLSANSDVVITMDADQSHTPGLIIRMIQMVHEGHDVVIASRYRRGARVFGVSLMRVSFSYKKTEFA